MDPLGHPLALGRLLPERLAHAGLTEVGQELEPPGLDQAGSQLSMEVVVLGVGLEASEASTLSKSEVSHGGWSRAEDARLLHGCRGERAVGLTSPAGLRSSLLFVGPALAGSPDPQGVSAPAMVRPKA